VGATLELWVKVKTELSLPNVPKCWSWRALCRTGQAECCMVLNSKRSQGALGTGLELRSRGANRFCKKLKFGAYLENIRSWERGACTLSCLFAVSHLNLIRQPLFIVFTLPKRVGMVWSCSTIQQSPCENLSKPLT
jgi:hypothetical protein